VARWTQARLHVAKVGAVAVVALAVVAGPGIVRAIGSLRPVPKPTLSVIRIAPVAPSGVIGRGQLSGKPWEVQLKAGKSWEASISCRSDVHDAGDCQFGSNYLWGKFPDQPWPVWLEVSTPLLIGRVKPDVSLVRVSLSDGLVANLHPVTSYGRRWVGLVVPDGASIGLVTAFAGRSELAHSTPFSGPAGDDPEFFTWLPPGDAGPRSMTKVISSTVLPDDKLSIGPWGNCVVFPSGDSCFSLGSTDWRGWFTDTGEPGEARDIIMAVRPKVAYVVFAWSNGRQERVQAARGSGVGFVAVRVTLRPSMLNWSAYDSAGQRLYGGTGAPDAGPGF
jgi:hypothetical protein